MTKSFLSAVALVAATALVPATAFAQQEMRAQETDTRQAEADFARKLEMTGHRIDDGEQARKITADRAEALRRRIMDMSASMEALSRQQGFVSAGEFASLNRSWSAIESELDRRGVGRRMDGDMLVAPDGEEERSFEGDMLPSAEMKAFERTHARLRYRGARIDHDARGCAVYRGKSRDGRTRRVPLRSPAGKPICVRM